MRWGKIFLNDTSPFNYFKASCFKCLYVFAFLYCLIKFIQSADLYPSAPSILTELRLNKGAPGTLLLPTVYFQ